jgi:hypothetical protein
MRTFVVFACVWVVLAHAALSPSPTHAQDPAPSEAQPAPDAAPAPAPAPEPEPVPAPAAQPEPAPAAPPPPPPPANDGDYGGRGYREPARHERYTPPPDYEEEPDDYGGSAPETHEFSVRLDPLNWLFSGRIGIELEYGLWEFISIELVPVIVAAESPLLLDFGTFEDTLTQHSNGVGPFSGISLGAGFWLNGEPFSGYVLRAYFTNYGYEYRASDAAGTFDRVKFTERRIVAFFGSHSRFGPFTLAGGFGLGYELNQQERCGFSLATPASGGAARLAARDTDCNDRQLIALDRAALDLADLNGSLHPVYIEARFSLGFVF